MSYWNPIERFGVDRFADELFAAGGAGVITADITPDEAGEWVSASDRVGLARIFLVAPSSTDARIGLTTAATTGFVYAAAVMGVTGARNSRWVSCAVAGRANEACHRAASVCGVGCVQR